jgi:ATP-dependent exoDNAse (exonuclease V) beta subunit
MKCCQTLTVCVQESKDGLARVQDFLEQVALWSEPEKAAAEEEQEGSPDVVNVMTLHLSKGLEFAVVFIVGKPIQCPCSAVNVLYASYSFAVIDRLPEAVSARHGNTDTANPVLLQFTC